VVTVDDMVELAAKAYIHEVKGGQVYQSPFSDEVKDFITRTRVSVSA